MMKKFNSSDIVLAVDDANRPEIFYSLQGEGPFTGRPSVFIRLSICNLFCTWCDTAYTWNWIGSSFNHTQNIKYLPQKEQCVVSIDDILHQIKLFQCRYIVLTGGEPLIQQKNLIPLLEQLNHQGYTIDIETNGTITPLHSFHRFVSHYVVSIKLSNSKIPSHLRIKEKNLNWFNRSEKTFFKFVVSNQNDFKEVQQMIHDYDIAYHKIYCMPLGSSKEQLSQNRKIVAQLCLDYGLKFSDRLHIHLYQHYRGV